MTVQEEIERIEAAFPAEFRDGFRLAFCRQCNGAREPGNYPIGFHQWPLERRNAWYAGFNRGLVERTAREKAAGHE